LTSVLATPATLPNAFFTVMGQAAQFMPGTDSVTILVADQAGPDIATTVANVSHDLFMVMFSQ
jgi:hypothetical protein